MTGPRSGAPARKRPPRKPRAPVPKAEMLLAELREARRCPLEDVARALKIDPPTVARLEKRTDMYVSNLRRYVEALGGQLKITAVFPEGEVAIGNFRDGDRVSMRRRVGRRSRAVIAPRSPE